jgi:hypothetical protein
MSITNKKILKREGKGGGGGVGGGFHILTDCAAGSFC